MPAQKLTKGRLAQILIMLSVLVGAFFWRTFTHETLGKVDCSNKERCNIAILDEKITIKRNSLGILIEVPKNSSLEIDLDQSGEYISVTKIHQPIEWQSISKSQVITLKLDQKIVEVIL